MKARLRNSVTTYQSTWHHNLANVNIYKSYLLYRPSIFRKDVQLTILGKNSNYTSWPVITKQKLKIIHTETIHVIGRNSKGSNSKNKNTTTRQGKTLGCYNNTDLTHARVDKTVHKTEKFIRPSSLRRKRLEGL
jgi:hypothetical protein